MPARIGVRPPQQPALHRDVDPLGPRALRGRPLRTIRPNSLRSAAVSGRASRSATLSAWAYRASSSALLILSGSIRWFTFVSPPPDFAPSRMRSHGDDRDFPAARSVAPEEAVRTGRTILHISLEYFAIPLEGMLQSVVLVRPQARMAGIFRQQRLRTCGPV